MARNVFARLSFPVLDKTELALQTGSAAMTDALLKLFGVPVFWQGFKFSMSGVQIEIAKECSGIRSSLALFITSIWQGMYSFGRPGGRPSLAS
jgi:hypothetical protein